MTTERHIKIWRNVGNTKLWELARNNRLHPTEAESVMWLYLRDKFYGTKFRRQQIIGNYIVDFINVEHSLVIEIDGGYHNAPEQKEYDRERDEYLTSIGLTVMRFTNEEVFVDIDNVLAKIKQFVIKGITPLQPSLRG